MSYEEQVLMVVYGATTLVIIIVAYSMSRPNDK